MIRIIEGVPGSGKSYFMMKYLSNYFKYDSFYDEFMVKDNVLVISNIDGLRVKHLDLNLLIEKYTVEGFFSVANFEKIQANYKVTNIILLIDEAQIIFDRKFYNTDVFFFFQYHRHLGVDVIFGTQGANLLPNAFIPLCEFIVEARPRSKSVMGSFSYHFKDKKGKFLYSKVLKKDQVIFKAYKSFTSDEISKPKNVVLHWLVICVVFLTVGIFCFKSALAIVKGKSEKAKVAHASTPPIMSMVHTSPVTSAQPQQVYNERSTQIRYSSAKMPSYAGAESQPSVIPPVSGSLPPLLIYKIDGYIKDGSTIVLTVKDRVFRLPHPAIKKFDLKMLTVVAKSEVLGQP